jgi:hypothetical protein
VMTRLTSRRPLSVCPETDGHNVIAVRRKEEGE